MDFHIDQRNSLAPRLVRPKLLVIVLLTVAVLVPAAMGATEKQKARNKKGNQAPELKSVDVPVPHIAWIFPAGGQRGARVKASIGGQGFTQARTIHASSAGVVGSVAKVVEDKSIQATISIAPDAPLGEHELRIVTPGGISNRIRFVVGQVPEVLDTEPNSIKSQAQQIASLPVVVNGQVMPGDIDCVRFSAKARQKLVLQVQARALQPYIADAVPGWMQATLAVYDAKGREVAYADDFRFDPDPVVSFTVPEDGDYVAEVKDAIFRGREDFVYRLTIGELPFISDVYPLGAQRGTTARVTLGGVNLPTSTLSIPVPASGPDRVPVSVASEGYTSNTVYLEAGDGPDIAESEPNDAPEKANTVTLPTIVNGTIGKPGDTDAFTFNAHRGDAFVFEVRARRLGSPLDSLLILLDSNGKVIVKNDDTVDAAQGILTHNADSRIDWKCGPSRASLRQAQGPSLSRTGSNDKAGLYTVRIADAQGKGGREYAYRLCMRPPRPDFSVRILPDNPRIAPGDTAVLTAEVLRIDGFDGSVSLALEGVTAAWSISGGTVPTREQQVRFTVTAPINALPGLMSPVFVGRSTAVRRFDKAAGHLAVHEAANAAAAVNDKPVAHRAWPAEEVMQAFSYQHRPAVQEFMLAVVKGGHFTLAAERPSDGGGLLIPRGGEVTFTVKVSRQAGADGPIRLMLDGAPKGIQVKQLMLAADQEQASLTVLGNPTASVGMTGNLIVSGLMRTGKGAVTRFAPAIPFRVIAGDPNSTTRPALSMSNDQPGPRSTVKKSSIEKK